MTDKKKSDDVDLSLLFTKRDDMPTYGDGIREMAQMLNEDPQSAALFSWGLLASLVADLGYENRPCPSPQEHIVKYKVFKRDK